MAELVYDWVILLASWGLILGGSAFVMIGAFGMLRFPDFWSRLHAASVSESAGMLLLIAGMALQSGWTLVTFKLVFIALLVFITGPTSTHAVANAALVSGLRPRDDVDGVEGAFPDLEAEP
ncbi:monovalent cation/H(+) antiporter subunit G [Alphaproteobacteria bacterium KMM 3653]|uniref:Monovalent cation/H(+) antiporter subunit G n=1 Tax=Harenicola maris TaxID=2841044 RepID=A0AAP2CSG2_9RHOB|nr:monovalent cation/H(+) antiporter subunit G [Harenicola maris]